MMFDWLRRMLGPCECCEALRESLTLERARNNELMLIVLPSRDPIPVIKESDVPIESQSTKFIPWKVRREMLEREDREKAKLMRQFKSSDSVSIEELEKEVGI